MSREKGPCLCQHTPHFDRKQQCTGSKQEATEANSQAEGKRPTESRPPTGNSPNSKQQSNSKQHLQQKARSNRKQQSERKQQNIRTCQSNRKQLFSRKQQSNRKQQMNRKQLSITELESPTGGSSLNSKEQSSSKQQTHRKSQFDKKATVQHKAMTRHWAGVQGLYLELSVAGDLGKSKGQRLFSRHLLQKLPSCRLEPGDDLLIHFPQRLDGTLTYIEPGSHCVCPTLMQSSYAADRLRNHDTEVSRTHGAQRTNRSGHVSAGKSLD